MKIEDARKKVQTYKNLIGTVDDKWFSVDTILIVPHDEKNRQRFFNNYVLDMDMEKALAPFLKEDLDVLAVDLKHLEDSQTLFFNKLS